MKKLFLVLMMSAFLIGCTSSTHLGQCIGVTQEPTPGLIYKASYWNLFLAFIFSETIVVPLVVVFDAIKCPVEKATVIPSAK
jgi:hypothetical protein